MMIAAFALVFVVVGGYSLYAVTQAASYVEIHIGTNGGGTNCVDGSSIATCDSSNPNRIWVPIPGSGNYAIKSKAGLCLDDWNGAKQTKPVSSGGVRAYVHYYTCYGGDRNQLWHWSGHELVSAASGGCLNGLGGTLTPGTQLGVYSCNGGQNEQFYETGTNVTIGGGGGGGTPTPAPSVGGYNNPLRSVRNLTPERVDQGVDYAGTGPVYAMGPGVITNVYNSGWPDGIFISYRLTDALPSQYKIYIYMSEGCSPNGLHIGQYVNSNTVICNMNGGIETGFAAPGLAEAMPVTGHGCFDGSDATIFGEAYNAVLKGFGNPGGIMSSTINCTYFWPSYWPPLSTVENLF